MDRDETTFMLVMSGVALLGGLALGVLAAGMIALLALRTWPVASLASVPAVAPVLVVVTATPAFVVVEPPARSQVLLPAVALAPTETPTATAPPTLMATVTPAPTPAPIETATALPTWTAQPLPSVTSSPTWTATVLPSAAVPTFTPAPAVVAVQRFESVAPPGAPAASPFTCEGGCAVAPDPSCAIKGNVNSEGEWIYHTPSSTSYERTDVKPEEGDRWFCTEAEAQAAGFRAPHN